MNELRSIVKGSLLENEPMSKHTSYGIGGPASAYIIPKDRDDLYNILIFATKFDIPVYFIGSGSNLLVSDNGINVSDARVKTSYGKPACIDLRIEIRNSDQLIMTMNKIRAMADVLDIARTGLS